MSSILRRQSVYGFEDRVVLDIGSHYIKCGLSGEHKPRHIIPFTLPVPHITSPEFVKMGQKCTSLYQLWMDDALDDLRKEILTYHLLAVYNKYLLTDPKQRKVVICENPLFPLKLKNVVAGILFEMLQVPSITFIHSSLLALITTGHMTGLVVDAGHLETTVVPVYDGRPMLNHIRTIPKAGESITSRLKLLIRNHSTLIDHSPPVLSDTQIESIPTETWEDIKARVCFIGKFPKMTDVSGDNREPAYPYRERAIPYTIYTSNAKAVMWRFGNDKVMIPGWVRERAGEILFEGDDDGESVASVCLDAIMKCPIDIRTAMAENIVLAGGTAMIPGFQARLMEHILQLLENAPQYNNIKRLSAKVKFVKTVFMRNCSVVGSIKNGGAEVSRESYLRDRKVPDWTDYTSPDGKLERDKEVQMF
ncbi:hypothetical protein HDU97_001353 [Phlyctochytrium planicorne]|nr:hypothetical protein HDU97_001353 [Phlyctochytrium planicorne]